jgi:hypothetical protein
MERLMVDILTIPTAPIVGTRTVDIYNGIGKEQRSISIQTFLTVSNDPNLGQYQTIQDAIDALPEEGGSVFVKNGTYVQQNSIIIPDKSIIIVGESMDKSIIDFNLINFNGISVDTLSSGNTIDISYIKIQNVKSTKASIIVSNTVTRKGSLFISKCFIDGGATSILCNLLGVLNVNKNTLINSIVEGISVECTSGNISENTITRKLNGSGSWIGIKAGLIQGSVHYNNITSVSTITSLSPSIWGIYLAASSFNPNGNSVIGNNIDLVALSGPTGSTFAVTGVYLGDSTACKILSNYISVKDTKGGGTGVSRGVLCLSIDTAISVNTIKMNNNSIDFGIHNIGTYFTITTNTLSAIGAGTSISSTGGTNEVANNTVSS